MYKIISTDYGDALVEYTQIEEDGNIVNEVTGVFLPEYGKLDLAPLKDAILTAFHNGEDTI